MSDLRKSLIRLAHTNPELRPLLLPLLRTAAPKAAPKLKGKKLENEVNACFYRFANNIQFDIMDLSKLYKSAEVAYLAAPTHEEGIEAMDDAMQKAITKFRKNGSWDDDDDYDDEELSATSKLDRAYTTSYGEKATEDRIWAKLTELGERYLRGGKVDFRFKGWKPPGMYNLLSNDGITKWEDCRVLLSPKSWALGNELVEMAAATGRGTVGDIQRGLYDDLTVHIDSNYEYKFKRWWDNRFDEIRGEFQPS